MKLENIKNEHDILAYIEGCLNDYNAGLADQNETSWAIVHLIGWVVQKERKNRAAEIEMIIKGKE